MNKKVLLVAVGGIFLVAVIVSLFGMRTKKEERQEDLTKSEEPVFGNAIVLYFSATNNTESVANQISQKLDIPTFEIHPVQEYTASDLDWNDENSRVSLEHRDENLRTVPLVTTDVENWMEYDTVFVGYPIWWGGSAWPVDTFVKANDWEGKTVIPFCTSASSELGTSAKALESLAKGGHWLEGHRFSSSPSEKEIDSWLTDIKEKIQK